MGAWFEAKILEVLKEKSVGLHRHPSSTSTFGTQSASIPSADSDHRVVHKDTKENLQKDGDESMVNKNVDEENNSATIGALDIGTNKADDKTNEQIGQQDEETVIKDENCNEGKSSGEENNMLKKRGVPMATDDDCSTEYDEPDSAVDHSVKQVECTTVLSPKKMSTSKENMAEAGNSSATCLLFKKEMSDDLKKQGILRETTVSDGFIYKVVFDG